MKWECEGCDQQFDDFSDDACDCGSTWERRFVLTLDDAARIETWAEAIHKRIELVCDALGYDMEYYDLDASGGIEIFSSESICGRYERHYETFPFSYLCMSTEEIKQTEEGRKAEEERQRKLQEAKDRKARELAAAQRAVKEAKRKTRTATTDAERALADAQARLARLGGAR